MSQLYTGPPALSLRVDVTLGRSVDLAVWQACELAAHLKLDWVNFAANDHEYTCYPNRAIRWVAGGKFGAAGEAGAGGTWVWEKSGVWRDGLVIEWVRVKAGVR